MNYLLEVRGADMDEYDKALTFRAADLSDAMAITELMMKHGHTVSIRGEKIEDTAEDGCTEAEELAR